MVASLICYGCYYWCNQGSVKLLDKNGFKEWGRMPNIVELGDNKFDHLYYGLHLTD